MGYTTITSNLDDVAEGFPPAHGHTHLMGTVGAGFHITGISVHGTVEYTPDENPEVTEPGEVIVIGGIQWVPEGQPPIAIGTTPDAAGVLHIERLHTNSGNFAYTPTSNPTYFYGFDPIDFELRMQWAVPQNADFYFSTTNTEPAGTGLWLLYATSRITYA